MGQEDLSWPWAVPPWGRSDVGKVCFSYPLQRFQTLFFFLLQQCVKTAQLKTFPSKKVLPFMCGCLGQCSPWAPRLWPRGTRARTEFFMFITRCRGRRDSSWIHGHMVLGPRAPSKAFLSVDGCQIFIVWPRCWMSLLKSVLLFSKYLVYLHQVFILWWSRD